MTFPARARDGIRRRCAPIWRRSEPESRGRPSRDGRARREVDATLSSAKAEADERLATAQAEADELLAAARIEADSKREAARSEAEMELAVDGLISAATGPATRLGRFGEELARSIDRVTNGRLGEADDSRQELVPVTAGNAVAASPDAEGSGPGS